MRASLRFDMRVTITGASGFLGTALCATLRQMGVYVIPVSRKQSPNYFTVSSFDESPISDVLVHLAEDSNRARVNQSSSSYEKGVLANLDRLASKGFQRIIYASSAVLYGDESFADHRVSDEVNVNDVYTRIKQQCESIVMESGNNVVVRLTNVYGAGMSSANVLSAILCQLPFRDSIKIWDGKPIRDFLWIADAADCIAKMVLGKNVGRFNLGSGESVSVDELIRIVLDVSNQKGRKVEYTKPSERESCIRVDIQETMKVWQWRPSVLLCEGVRNMIVSGKHNE